MYHDRCFDGDRLRLAMIDRGWTVAEFSVDSGVHIKTLYHALSGRPVTDRTAIRIFTGLRLRQPSVVAS